jgi:hypothetical protein
MGATILILAVLTGDPARMVAGYFRAPARAELENAEQFPAPELLLALPLPADKAAPINYPIVLDVEELEALYASTRKPGLLYEIARKHQALGDDAEAEAYFRAFLSRAPALDPFHDAAWSAVVEYSTRREAEAAELLRARAREAVPEPMAAMLSAIGFDRF